MEGGFRFGGKVPAFANRTHQFVSTSARLGSSTWPELSDRRIHAFYNHLTVP